jgi:hypothetical protein
MNMTDEETKPKRWLWWGKKYWILGGTAVMLVALILTLLLHPWRHGNAVLPADITDKITTFTPYQPELLPAGLHVEQSSVNFDGNRLVFRLSKPGVSMVITEQPTPPGLASRTYPSEKIDGVDGTAYLSRDHTRTFATLFATGRGNKPTMILINTNDPFTSDDIKDLVRSFRAAQ